MRTTNADRDRPDAASGAVQVGVGVAGVYGQVSVPSGFWTRLTAGFRRAPLEDLVKAAAAFAEARVPGEITVTLCLVNFSKAMLLVEDVHLKWASVGNGALRDIRPTFHGHGQELPPRSLSRVPFRIPILDVEVSDLRRWIGEAPNQLSSPRGTLELAGHVRVKRKEMDRRIPFVLKQVPTHWHVESWEPGPGPSEAP